MKRAVWEENMKMIKLHNMENGLGKNGFTMKMNAFADMVSVTWIASHCVLLSALHGLWYGVCVLPCFILMLFSLKTGEEFRKSMNDIPIPAAVTDSSTEKQVSIGLPNFKDWRKEGYVTPVRNQVRQWHIAHVLKPL